MKGTGFRVQVLVSLIISLLFTVICPLSTVSAHAFGVQYTLPVPIWLYLYGGAAAVALSFIVVGIFLRQTRSEISYPTKKLFKTPTNFLIPTAKLVSLFFFLLTIVSGLIGSFDSLLNFNMTFFWIIFLLGLTYLTLFAGNLYSVINPWRTLAEFLEKFLEMDFKGIKKYPEKLSYLPAFLFYFLLIWTELVSKVNPFSLSLRLTLYTLIAFLLMFVYGKEIWLKYFDFFGVYFRLFSKISIIEKKGNQLLLRPPFVGAIKEKASSIPEVVFILFMLSSTAFDGFHSTTVWFRFEFAHLVNLEEALGNNGFSIIETIALFVSAVIFFTLFAIFTYLMKLITNNKNSLKELLFDFAYSLIPIAFVYNFAHYYTLLFIQGQSIISLISDPFGFGWNLFNTSNFTPNIGLLGANLIWNSQVAVIILGHIAAVYLAHVISLKVFPSHKKALLSQLPMLLLMVCYTMAGLWILSQPITGG